MSLYLKCILDTCLHRLQDSLTSLIQLSSSNALYSNCSARKPISTHLICVSTEHIYVIDSKQMLIRLSNNAGRSG